MATSPPPQQLPLKVQLRASSVFSSYYAGPNQESIAVLKDWSSAAHPLLFVYGAKGVGKTHVLQAVCAKAGEQHQRATYLPLRELQGFGPELLIGTEHMSLVCIDDVAPVLAQPEWNRALFNLYRELDERGGKLLLADEQPPASIQFALPDLASRVLAGAVLRLQALSDAEQISALRLHATQRGMKLPEDVAAFLLRRLPRDMHTLCAFIDQLDLASLSAQRKLTVPFVKKVLPGHD